ncbi:hypothetical protein BDV10DRAFT_177038 [Aspergillus recurvatus]
MHPTLIIAPTVIPLAFAMPNIFIVQQDPFDTGDPACLPWCMHQKPACPENMDAKQQGKCWSCCLRDQVSFSAPQSQSPAEQAQLNPIESEQNCHLQFGENCCTYDGCALCCNSYCHRYSSLKPPYNHYGMCDH